MHESETNGIVRGEPSPFKMFIIGMENPIPACICPWSYYWLHVNLINTISRLFGTFLADFRQVFVQNLSRNSEEKEKPNSKSLFPNMCHNFGKKCWKSAKCKLSAEKGQMPDFTLFLGQITAKIDQNSVGIPWINAIRPSVMAGWSCFTCWSSGPKELILGHWLTTT